MRSQHLPTFFAVLLSGTLAAPLAPAHADAPRVHWLTVEIRDGATRASPEILAVPIDPSGTRAVVEARTGGVATSAGVQLTGAGRASVAVWRTLTTAGATAVVLHVESEVALTGAETTIAQHRGADGRALSVIVRAL